MTYTAVRHQGAIKMFWGAVIPSIIQSMARTETVGELDLIRS